MLKRGSLLAFDRKDTWSIKYNIIWDKLLNLGLFPKEVYKKEVEAYKAKMCRYGVPLDCRSDYAKTGLAGVDNGNDRGQRIYRNGIPGKFMIT